MRVLTRALRLIIRIARSAPNSALTFPPTGVFSKRLEDAEGRWDVQGQKKGEGVWWPGRADPETVCLLRLKVYEAEGADLCAAQGRGPRGVHRASRGSGVPSFIERALGYVYGG